MFSDIVIIQKDLFIAKLTLSYIRYCTKIIAQIWSLASRLLLIQIGQVFTDRIKTSKQCRNRKYAHCIPVESIGEESSIGWRIP